MNPHWTTYSISPDATHHLAGGRPAYPARFWEVLKFHAPGLAPVLDESGAYHISPSGAAAYSARFVRTFGFYDGRAAVSSQDGWLHVLPDGRALYDARFAWAGNFQDGLCPVRDMDGGYFHMRADGQAAYAARHAYAGDFRDGFAVVQDADGMHTHIDASGVPLHGRRFLDLDVFHKGNARARDADGWHHVDAAGEPLYAARFAQVEPFYNGQARVEDFDGSLSVICENGERIASLRKPLRSPLERLSGEMVGLWRTQTIRAAVELGVFERLPSSARELERDLGLAQSVGERLALALAEMGLVERDAARGVWRATPLGAHLRRSHPLSLADAAAHWGRESYAAWGEIIHALREGRSGFEKIYGANFFAWLARDPESLRAYHAAMSAYARHDYASIAESVDFGAHRSVLDAGGGAGELSFAILRACPWLTATVMDRPEVIAAASAPADLADRCRFIAGDLFAEWSATDADAIILARVLHDWNDRDALKILRRARQAMRPDSTLYIVEMILDEDSHSGGLLDLHMLTMTEGAERTPSQFRRLLSQAGFEMMDAAPTSSVSSVVRAAAV